jgi:hypothetical protein
MPSKLEDLFNDPVIIQRVRDRLPVLFYIAEQESSRAGKVGMEVGSLRENILIAMLVYYFGEGIIDTNIPINESEIDLRLSGSPVSIKTKTGAGFGGVKLSWTVDASKAHEFFDAYHPNCDILLAQIHWEETGGLFYVPVEVQREILDSLGKDSFFKLPKPGTNPRGIEMTEIAMSHAVTHPSSKNISILWKRPSIRYNKYERWITYWRNK